MYTQTMEHAQTVEKNVGDFVHFSLTTFLSQKDKTKTHMLRCLLPAPAYYRDNLLVL